MTTMFEKDLKSPISSVRWPLLFANARICGSRSRPIMTKTFIWPWSWDSGKWAMFSITWMQSMGSTSLDLRKNTTSSRSKNSKTNQCPTTLLSNICKALLLFQIRTRTLFLLRLKSTTKFRDPKVRKEQWTRRRSRSLLTRMTRQCNNMNRWNKYNHNNILNHQWTREEVSPQPATTSPAWSQAATRTWVLATLDTRLTPDWLWVLALRSINNN